MRQPDRVLIIVQRSNGDVFLASPLIEAIQSAYPNARIDLLVNDDTVAIARMLPHIRTIHTYSYRWKKLGKLARYKEELGLVGRIRGQYDLAINLTASDRSVLYALLAGKVSISAVESDAGKSWWKRRFLDYSYPVDADIHVVRKNMQALDFLNIPQRNVRVAIKSSERTLDSVKVKLQALGIGRFFIFHPTAQYEYKVYPEGSRNALLQKLSDLGIPVLVTGAKSELDTKIKASLPKLPHIFDFVGETSLEEYVALSQLSSGYIGMDTLNMHIAAAQDKRIFAIFGPTLLTPWAPWSNASGTAATQNRPVQTYNAITIFQADMPCVACGKAGCDDRHGKSDCLYQIDPDMIFGHIRDFAAGLEAGSASQ